MRVDGLEPGVNDNDRDRSIVVHKADYAGLTLAAVLAAAGATGATGAACTTTATGTALVPDWLVTLGGALGVNAVVPIREQWIATARRFGEGEPGDTALAANVRIASRELVAAVFAHAGRAGVHHCHRQVGLLIAAERPIALYVARRTGAVVGAKVETLPGGDAGIARIGLSFSTTIGVRALGASLRGAQQGRDVHSAGARAG